MHLLFTGEMTVTSNRSEVLSGSLSLYRWLTFVSMYVGYMMSVVNRKCFSFALPAIINSLHLEKDDAGKKVFMYNPHVIILSACTSLLPAES